MMILKGDRHVLLPIEFDQKGQENGQYTEVSLRDENEHPYRFALAKASRNTVQFPAITKLSTYIFRHFSASIVDDIRQQLLDGDLAYCFGVDDFTEDSMAMADCRISQNMSFWWQYRYGLIADLEVYLAAAIRTESINERRNCVVYATLFFTFEEQINYDLEEIRLKKPDRDCLRLDDYLIPIMGYDDVENAAEQMWLTYVHQALADRIQIDAYLLAKAMGLSIMCLRLYKKPKTKSILFWSDTRVFVQQSDNGYAEPEEVLVPRDTIVININLIDEDYLVPHIFHECFHAEYHWLFYRLQRMHNNDLRTIKKKKKQRNQGKEPKNPLPILEWEARQGGRSLLMPRCLVLPMIRQYEEEERKSIRHAGLVMEKVGRHLSGDWGVPKYVVRARMIHLGFWWAQGALNYVATDCMSGEYIRPFMFDRESCPSTAHTFVISPADAFKLYEQNEEFRARLDTGNYVYAEGHICVNNPEYVVQTTFGPMLTDWANRHVDDCCLRFENIYEVDENYEFHLNSINSDEEYNRHYIDFIAGDRDLTKRELNEQQSEVIAKLPHKPGEALIELMKMNGGMTKEALAEAALVSSRTVQRWRKEEYSFDAETVVRIIVAMSLPPWLSYWFLDVAKVSLQYYGLHMLYRNIINCHYMDSLREVNVLIEAAGYEKFKDAA